MKVPSFTLVLLSTTLSLAPVLAQEPDLASLRLPPGFSISVYAEVPGARQMALDDQGVVYVGQRAAGKIVALPDGDGDHRADRVITVAEGLNSPNGVAWYRGDLYIGEINRISRIADVTSKLGTVQPTQTLNDSLPDRRQHGYRFIDVGPDGKLYVPVGAPCNVCEEEAVFASLHTMNLDGSNMQKIAAGIRNSVGFDWHPVTGELWFTDNGRDMLGDDLPSCELNRLSASGQHFGFPYIHQGDLPDPQFGAGRNPADYVPPVQKLGPHVAPLGMAFYHGDMFPADYRNAALIALHGSWNRSEKSGYTVMVARLGADNISVVDYQPFIEGWLQGQDDWGRPVDLQVMPDGSVLISDDGAGLIYRVAYGE